MAPPPLLLFLLGALQVPSAAAAQPRAANASAAPTVEVRVGVLLPQHNLRLPWALPRVAPALSLALEALEPDLRRAGFAVSTAFASREDKEGTCGPMAHYTAGDLSALHADLLLGLGCYGTIAGVAPFAHYWQLPVLRAGHYQRMDESSQALYFGPVGPHLRAFEARLLGHFNWTASRPVLVIDATIEYWQHYVESLMSTEDDLAHTPNYTGPVLFYKQPDETIRFLQAKGRVVYICGSLEMLQQIMHLAQAQNMTNGDYVFLFLDIFGESLRAEGHREAAKPWQGKESQDTGGLREAFQAVLVITSHEPQTPEYQCFQSQLILRAQRDFGVTLNDSLGHLVAGCFHDGLLLYLRALNETLREGGTKRDTSRILEKMRGQKFLGVTGMVSISSNNEREMDFDLWAMRDVESGEYQVVAHYIASEKQISWLGPIHWKAGRPPLDNPPCVFNMDDPSCGTMLHDYSSPHPTERL